MKIATIPPDSPGLFTTNLAIGYNDEIDVYSGLFLVTVLDLERSKYSFGRKYKKRIDKTKIKLPMLTNESGEFLKDSKGNYMPDWGYMSEYIKSLPYTKYIVKE